MIGATAHYVTADLDEGPIIAQDVEHVPMRIPPETLVRKGGISSGAYWRARCGTIWPTAVLLNGEKTVVFTD